MTPLNGRMSDMYDPTMRVLATLELLESHESMTAADLAARLEVSKRTVQRYVTRLQDLGIPVHGTRGVGGAYRLQAGFRLPPMVFNDDEALAITLGLRALKHLGLSTLAPAEATAAAKLERVLPKAVREGLLETLATLELESSPWIVPTNPELIKRLARAAKTQSVIEMQYQSKSQSPGQRRIEPYAVLNHEGRWYVVAHCQLRLETRVFRVDRIGAATTLELHFERPASVDARAVLLEARPSNMWQLEVWVDLDAAQLQERVPAGQVTLSPDGCGTLLTARTANLEWMAAMLLSLRCDLEVRAPAALRDAFAGLSERAGRYSSHSVIDRKRSM